MPRRSPEERGRGTLVSSEKLYTLATPQAVATELGAAGFEDDAVRHGVVRTGWSTGPLTRTDGPARRAGCS
ncbi:hypothetical protein ACTU45_26755 [Streptomyces sp. 24-1644]|uniref:hypothetical protein n=1 Tax=Streptomyces sp. 24-1644 TaxID=3457315 RepID=UPI003FA759AA